MSDAPPHFVADRYRLVQPLGQGGMGRVWRARDEVLHRDVAIKELVPPPGLTDDERREMRERSLREARAIARLNNANVVRVFDVLRTGGDPWIVMEYVPSRSLQDTLAMDGPVSPLRAAEIGLGVLGALRAAHRSGVMHRDVKPANVLLGDDGRVVLTDFGLATVPGDPTVTRTGLVLGSPAYLAPERARDGTAGPEADLWSLGATLYAAIEGKSPYARPSAMGTIAALATEPLPPAKNAGPLKPVLGGLLRKDPAQRITAETAERLLRRVVDRRSRGAMSLLDGVRRPSPRGSREARTNVPPSPSPLLPVPRPAPDQPARTPGPTPPPPGPAARRPRPAPTSPPPVDVPALPPPVDVPALPSSSTTPPGETSTPPPVGAATSITPEGGASSSNTPPGETSITPTPPGKTSITPSVGASSSSDATAIVAPSVDLAAPTVQVGSPQVAVPGEGAVPGELAAPDGPAGAVPPATEPAAMLAVLPAPDGPTESAECSADRSRPGTATGGPARPGPGPMASAAGGKRRRWPFIAVAAALLLLALAVIVPLFDREPAGDPTTQGAGGATHQPPTAQASPPPAPTSAAPTRPAASATGLPEPVVPAGWHLYKDETGFQVPIPDGWRVKREIYGSAAADEVRVTLSDPRSGRWLLVDQNNHPKGDPVADWTAQEANRRGGFANYHRITITAVSYWDRAADWEWTYTDDDGRPVRTRNRGFVTARDKAYALRWQTPVAAWNDNLDDFQVIADGFRPVRH